jgi:hypothetical protein
MSTKVYQLETLFKDHLADQWIGQPDLGFKAVELSSGYSRGVQLVTLRCWDKTVEVVPTRGLGIWRASRSAIRFGWDSPIQGPIHPHWVDLGESSGLGWLDGFDELMVRCGVGSNGAPEFFPDGKLKWGLHGRIANLPASEVELEVDQAAESISIRGVVVEQRFHFYRWALTSKITISRESPEIEIFDRIENQSNRPGSVQLLYHCNFGPPVLEQGSRLVAPVAKVFPRDEASQRGFSSWDVYRDPDSQYREEVYFLELAADRSGFTRALLTNRDQSLGAYVRYAVDKLPYFTLWKNTVGLGDGYVTGLEPGTNYPNVREVEESAGRVVNLAGGESIQFQCAIGMLVDSREVRHEIDQIQMLGAGLG